MADQRRTGIAPERSLRAHCEHLARRLHGRLCGTSRCSSWRYGRSLVAGSGSTW